MVKVYDVVAFILEKEGVVRPMKLHTLVYYCQVWYLVWYKVPLFEESIQAWAFGSVVPKLYEWHQGKTMIDSCPDGDVNNLTSDQRETIITVLEFYGDTTYQDLSDLIHQEKPWIDARYGLQPTKKGGTEITHNEIIKYYSNL